jgi:glycosyltransferase involved in cell wall biosynthesis
MKNILVVTYWSFKDPLIQTYTLPYVQLIKKQLPQGSRIFLFTLTQDRYALPAEEFDKYYDRYAQQGIYIVQARYESFGVKAMLKLGNALLKLHRLCMREKISYIHAWCSPGGALGYILSKLTGIPLVLDSFEPHAESMVESGTWKKTGLAYKLLYWLEKKQAKRAIAFIGLTESMKDYAYRTYHVELKRYYIKPACVNFKEFDHTMPVDTALRNELGLDGKIVCVYAGKFGGIYLHDEVFVFFKAAHEYWGDRFRALVLTSAPPELITEGIIKAALPPGVVISRFVDHSQVSRHMRLADFALNPVKPTPSKRHCTSIKDGEYWAMGLPVVITQGISDDSDIIERNRIGAVLKGLSREHFLQAVKRIDELLAAHSREELAEKIVGIAKRYRSFENAARIYGEIYPEKD